MMKHWRTTALGIGTILTGLGMVIHGMMGEPGVDVAAGFGLIVAGIAQINSADAKNVG